MTCIEAEPHVSALCDGEPVPAEAVEHFNACETCRITLAEYARIGTELRVAAAMDTEALTRLDVPRRRRTFDFLWRRVPVPRFALAALMVLTGAAVASVPLVRAQQRPLWFQFGYALEPGGKMSSLRVATPGFEESTMTMVKGAPGSAALRIRVESVSTNDVVVRCRAVPGRMEPTSDGGRVFHYPDSGVSLKYAPAVHYKPGEQLTIPIEGGGAIYLKGDVYEQQPKIAFGYSLEPRSNQLVMRWPVLVSDGEVLAELSGGTATAGPGSAVTVAAGNHGRFLFALEPFPGAIEGKIEWGQMTFAVDARSFRLVAAAPLASGEQPRPVWVRHDPNPAQVRSIGSVRLRD